MAKFSLRRYDTQARISVLVSAASAVAALGVAVMMLQHLDRSDWTVYYGPTRRIVILAGAAVTFLLAAGGFGLGLNSAGQRRNDKQSLSWLGFFLGASVLCVTLVLIYFFQARGESVVQ